MHHSWLHHHRRELFIRLFSEESLKLKLNLFSSKKNVLLGKFEFLLNFLLLYLGKCTFVSVNHPVNFSLLLFAQNKTKWDQVVLRLTFLGTWSISTAIFRENDLSLKIYYISYIRWQNLEKFWPEGKIVCCMCVLCAKYGNFC